MHIKGMQKKHRYLYDTIVNHYNYTLAIHASCFVARSRIIVLFLPTTSLSQLLHSAVIVDANV